jgi:hypothetical protein
VAGKLQNWPTILNRTVGRIDSSDEIRRVLLYIITAIGSESTGIAVDAENSRSAENRTFLLAPFLN